MLIHQSISFGHSHGLVVHLIDKPEWIQWVSAKAWKVLGKAL